MTGVKWFTFRRIMRRSMPNLVHSRGSDGASPAFGVLLQIFLVPVGIIRKYETGQRV
jgi:hypothetical protein